MAARPRSEENQAGNNQDSRLKWPHGRTQLRFVFVTHQTVEVFQEGQDIHQFRVVLVREPALNGDSIFQVIPDEGGERKEQS